MVSGQGFDHGGEAEGIGDVGGFEAREVAGGHETGKGVPFLEKGHVTVEAVLGVGGPGDVGLVEENQGGGGRAG